MKRIGHKGADLIEAGNTIASFEAARAHAVDAIEFDVIAWRGGLVVAHDAREAYERGDALLTLDAALDHLAGPDFGELLLDIDLKDEGTELETLEAIEQRGLTARSIVTTQHLSSLSILRHHAPALRIGWTVPPLPRTRPDHGRLTKLMTGAGNAMHRGYLPDAVGRMMRGGRIDVVMAFHSLVTPRLVAAAHEHGGEVFAWTVDEPGSIARLAELGVDGIVTNDPRLFSVARRPLVSAI